MKKEITNTIRQEETMEDCWEALDKFYHRPMKATDDLMAEITAFKKMQDTDMEGCMNIAPHCEQVEERQKEKAS